jgi:hypothetical protein
VRIALTIVTVTLIVLGGLHALDREYAPAIILAACAVVTAIALERF